MSSEEVSGQLAFRDTVRRVARIAKSTLPPVTEIDISIQEPVAEDKLRSCTQIDLIASLQVFSYKG